MSNAVKIFAAFIVGAAVGVVSTMKYFEKKYSEKADRDIADVKAAYGFASKLRESTPEEPKPTDQNDTFKAYSRKVSEYSNYSSVGPEADDDESVVQPGVGEIAMTRCESRPDAEDRPYMIEPSQWGDCDDYDLLDLDWYEDGVLADSWGEKIEHPELVIGSDAIHAFDDYDTVQIWVRNDARRIDYEINRKDMKYSDLPDNYAEAFPDNPLDVK